MDYSSFILSKKHSAGEFGFDPVWIPDGAFDFQRHIISKAVRKGRIGIFADTGLGKTLMQIAIAENIVRHTNKRVLILTPLAVAFQFIDEAKRIGVEDIGHSKTGQITKKIIVCNYERLHLLNPDDFVCVMLDESSILKNFNGKTRDSILAFIKKVEYRYLSTATPSPNDFIELGNSSEALGHMGYMDMLSRFFKSNQNSIDSNNRNIGEKFYLKPHAEDDFFAWVNQWSLMVKKPSDLGFSDESHKLPELKINSVIVENDRAYCADGQFDMFGNQAARMTDVRAESKDTAIQRCEKAVELANGKTSVYWCNTNDESNLLKNADSDAVEIIGSMSMEAKEEALINFANGNIKRLITKASMTGMGLNWQHCNHSVFFPTWSYEQYYQAVRRFWRFGQKKDVTIDMVSSSRNGRVIKALEEKSAKADILYSKIIQSKNGWFLDKAKQFNTTVTLPEFIK